jgi:outer membrane biosynthesis protein TonB
MAARLAAVLPRFAILTIAFLLATATITFAAQRSMVAAPAAETPAASAPEALVVPDVRGQAYVFAKGMLEDGGFAWQVKGAVQGYAANTVASQTPAPGTRVLDTGAPTIVLLLRRNRGYAQEGTPENAAPFNGTAVRLADAPKKAPVKKAPAKKPATAKKVATPKKAKAAPAPKPKSEPAAKAPQPKPAARPAAFAVRGAPKEPAGEMSLPARARRLEAWLGTHRRPTGANVRAYLYQHSWIVTGARFGWWHGEEALRLLLRADRRAQRLWGIGAKSEVVTRRALRLVAARSR